MSVRFVSTEGTQPSVAQLCVSGELDVNVGQDATTARGTVAPSLHSRYGCNRYHARREIGMKMHPMIPRLVGSNIRFGYAVS